MTGETTQPAPGPTPSAADATTASPPGAPPLTPIAASALPAGFYQLTLLAVLISMIEVRIRPLPGLPSLSLLELVVVPALVGILVERLGRPGLAARIRVIRHNRALAGYIGYAGLAAGIGLSRSADSLQAFHDLAAAYALFALIVLTVDTRGRLLGLLATCLAAAIPSVLLGVLQIATGGFYLFPRSTNIDAKMDLAGEAARNAPVGVFSHPNGLALYLLPIAVFLAVAAWRGFGARRRLSLVLCGVLAVLLVVLKVTYAKGVYAWLAVALGFLALPRPFDRWRAWLAVIVPVAGITTLVWITVDAFLRGDLQYGTVISRIELWLSAIDILQDDRFVTVVGSGGPQLLARGLVTFEYPNPHNAWLSQALTYGAPALVLYLAAYVSAFRSLARTLRSADAATRALALAAMATLMALLGENFFEPADRGVAFQSQLLLVFAIAACTRATAPVATPVTGAARS
jgi:hypothetical protein